MTQQKRQNTTIYFVLHIFISIMFSSSRSTQSWEKIINKKTKNFAPKKRRKLFEKNVSIKYVLFYHRIRLTLEQKSTFLIYTTFLSTKRFFFLKITNHDMNIIMESFYVFSKALSQNINSLSQRNILIADIKTHNTIISYIIHLFGLIEVFEL